MRIGMKSVRYRSPELPIGANESPGLQIDFGRVPGQRNFEKTMQNMFFWYFLFVWGLSLWSLKKWCLTSASSQARRVQFQRTQKGSVRVGRKGTHQRMNKKSENFPETLGISCIFEEMLRNSCGGGSLAEFLII